MPDHRLQPGEFVVTPAEAGRVDRVLQGRFPDAGRRTLAGLFERRAVRIDGRVARKGDRVAAGAVIRLSELPAGPAALRAAPDPRQPLPLLHEDAALVAVAKPAAMPSHPLAPGERGTAANWLVHRFPECRHVGRDPREAGLVHRLDRDTTGVLVAARDQTSWAVLRQAFGAGRVRKQYLALVRGTAAAGACDAPLATRGQRAVVRPGADDALPAATSWEPVEQLGDFALLRCTAHSGRMHQVRAHLAHAGLPIVGDLLYGGPPRPDLPADGHFLHAVSLCLPHPLSGSPLTIEAPLPQARLALLAALRAGA
jgi:23S rRNA pseudouridine1911/1915/1917 synthase